MCSAGITAERMASLRFLWGGTVVPHTPSLPLRPVLGGVLTTYTPANLAGAAVAKRHKRIQVHHLHIPGT